MVGRFDFFCFREKPVGYFGSICDTAIRRDGGMVIGFMLQGVYTLCD